MDTIYNLSNEEYHRGERFKEYLSSTQIKDYLISPKFAKYKREHPQQFEISMEAREKGSLYHNCMESIVETGDIKAFIDSVFVFDPPINKKTGKPYGYDTQAYEQALAEAMADNPGKELVSQSDVDLVKSMVNELLYGCRQTSKDVRQIIKWGKAEVSHFVEYEGCKFKYRPDVETKKKIVDWKTVSADDLHEDTIRKIITKFNYDISAAFYQFFENVRTGEWKEFYWVFQQKSPPFDAVLVSASQFAYRVEDGVVLMGNGAQRFRALLDQHIWCEKSSEFDGAQIFIQPQFMGRRIMEPKPSSFDRLMTFYNE